MFRARLALLRAFALVCALVIFLATPRVCASQSNDQGLAPSVAAALTKAKVKRVVIFDFIGPGYVNQLGRDLAEGLSESLAKEHKKFHIVDRPALSAAFEKNLVRPELVREPEVAWWLASQLRADALIVGKLLAMGNQLEITIGLVAVRDGKQLDGFSFDVPLTEDMQKRLNKPLNEDYPDKFAKEGASVSSLPACLHCPRPDYSESARDHKYEGTVVLAVLIGADGLPKKITVSKPLQYGLTLKAIEAVQKWDFKPAIGLDGKPVDTWAPIELSFRLF